MTSANFEALRQAVVRSSVANNWGDAVGEWEVTSIEEEPDSSGVCICGQTGLLWLFTITNQRNDSELAPIGSSCVNHFDRADLNRQVDVLGALIRIRTAVRNGEPVTLTTDFFTRLVLQHL